MSIKGLLGINATYHIDRYRTYAYTSETTIKKRTGSVANNSFFAGHHPDSKVKFLFYGIASLATRATAYKRLRGGENSPSDNLLGTATGVLAGILVPHYPKTKSNNNSGISILPYSTGEINELAFNYKVKNYITILLLKCVNNTI